MSDCPNCAAMRASLQTLIATIATDARGYTSRVNNAMTAAATVAQDTDAGSALLARLRAIETAAWALSAALESPPWSNAQATGEQSAPTGEGGHDDWIRGHKHALWQFAQTVGAAGDALRAALDAKAGS